MNVGEVDFRFQLSGKIRSTFCNNTILKVSALRLTSPFRHQENSMSSRRLLVPIVSMMFLSIFAEISSGQILLRRRRERLKSEMKNELQQQLDANLESKVSTASSELSKKASDQIKAEAAALRMSFKTELIAMRSEANRIISEEKTKIARNAANEIAKIKRAADSKIATVKKELLVSNTQSINSSITTAEQKLKNAMDEFSRVLASKNGDAFVKFEKNTASRFDTLKSEVNSLIDNQIASEVAKVIRQRIAKSNAAMEKRIATLIDAAMAKNQNSTPEPDSPKEEKGEKKAILNRTPRLTEDV